MRIQAPNTPLSMNKMLWRVYFHLRLTILPMSLMATRDDCFYPPWSAAPQGVQAPPPARPLNLFTSFHPCCSALHPSYHLLLPGFQRSVLLPLLFLFPPEPRNLFKMKI